MTSPRIPVHAGPAEYADMQALHRELCKALADGMSAPQPGAALLDVTRKFLRQDGVRAMGPRDYRRMRILFQALCDCLQKALQGPEPPPAALLAVVHAFLRDCGAMKDLSMPQAKQSLALLASDEVPFRTVQ